jgi:hypothetical protein
MRTHLTFNTHARLFGWMTKNKEKCVRVTGEDPMICFAKPLVNMDLGPMTYAHADFPPKIQWWLKKHCPYQFVKTGEAKSTLLMRIRNYRLYAKKEGHTTP